MKCTGKMNIEKYIQDVWRYPEVMKNTVNGTLCVTYLHTDIDRYIWLGYRYIGMSSGMSKYFSENNVSFSICFIDLLNWFWCVGNMNKLQLAQEKLLSIFQVYFLIDSFEHFSMYLPTYLKMYSFYRSVVCFLNLNV